MDDQASINDSIAKEKMKVNGDKHLAAKSSTIKVGDYVYYRAPKELPNN
jgi:hypothetical protein